MALQIHNAYNGGCRKRDGAHVTIRCVLDGETPPACECIRCDSHIVTCSAVAPDYPKVCSVTFERLADKKMVPCILVEGHWPKTAHAFR